MKTEVLGPNAPNYGVVRRSLPV